MSDDILLGRQPILNQRLELVAYEFLFREPRSLERAVVTDHVHATATVITHAFSQFGIADVLGACRGYINVDKEFLNDDAIELLPMDKVVLEVLENGAITPEVIERCRELKDNGYTLALDDFVHMDERARAILDLVSIVKVDLAVVDDRQLDRLAAELRKLPVTLLAEKVESREQMERCRALGFHLFQGYFFARPAIISGRRLSPSQGTLIRLLNLLGQDAALDQVEAALKQEPALTLNLLRLSNSVAVGARTRIGSIRGAIAMLGRRQLQRWLQLLLYADASASALRTNPILILAATRGRFMELLAERLHPADKPLADLAFMVGIMSLMPAVFGIGMEEILGQIVVVQEIRQALLERQGTAGRLLDLVESSEETSSDRLLRCIAEMPGLASATVSECLTQAMIWAQLLGEERD